MRLATYVVLLSIMALSMVTHAHAQQVTIAKSTDPQITGINSQVTTVQTAVTVLETEVTKITFCGDNSLIYAPSHPLRDSNDCFDNTAALATSVTTLETKVTTLETELAKYTLCGSSGLIYAPGHASADGNGCISTDIPTGTIAAFTTSCPAGWTTFPAANGRFLVGVGGGYSVGNTGGANNVTLTISQMPNHQHNSGVTARTNSTGMTTPWGKSSGVSTNTWEHHKNNGSAAQSRPYTSFVGGGAAHENRPPYYAVRWCRKN